MTPDQLLMQLWHYWTQPDTLPSYIKPPEDHEATVAALKTGAETIVEVYKLKQSIADLTAERDQALADNDNLRQRVIELEDELRVARGE